MSIFDSYTDLGTTKRIGIAGFTGFARVRETVNYKADSPNNVLEDGSNASDDIINSPIQLSISGVVADLFAETAPTPTDILGVDTSAVGEVNEFLPAQSQAVLQQIAQVNYRINQGIEIANRAERAAGDLYSFITGSGGDSSKTLQQQFIDHMETIYYNKQLIDIEVENRTFSDMQISFTLTRDNQSDQYQFTINAKQVNYVSLIFVPVETQYSSPSAAVSDKVAGATDKGVQNPEDSAKSDPESNSKSILSSLVGG